MMVAGKLVSLTFLSVGLIILMQIALPLISFRLWEIGQKYSQKILISPKPNYDQKLMGISIKNQDNFPTFFSELERETQSPYSEFSLSVPSIKIEGSIVRVDSNDLARGLIHLPGSALPGEKGNIFISGHSAIPLFGKSHAIFARLTDIKKEDKILVKASGANFVYKVIDIRAVDPNDLSVIAPPDQVGRFISLMTCVPPGLNFKRLVILGKMI